MAIDDINYVKSVAVFTETKGLTRLWISYVGVLMAARTVLLPHDSYLKMIRPLGKLRIVTQSNEHYFKEKERFRALINCGRK